jgi:hypothetical protein
MAIVNMVFDDPFTGFAMEGVTGQPDPGGLRWSFEINKELGSVGHFLTGITKIAEPKEIEIKERSIEDIIHGIMKKMRGPTDNACSGPFDGPSLPVRANN